MKDAKKPIQELDPEERAAFAHLVMAQRRTPDEIWRNENWLVRSRYLARTTVAAELLAGQPAVVDLGCGGMGLEAALPPDVSYLPVDLFPRDERTVVVDLNRDPPPLLPAPAVACLGLLEYIYDVAGLLSALVGHYPTAVISYNHADAPSGNPNRRSNVWLNDYSRAEMEALFATAGYAIRESRLIAGPEQVLWRLCRE